MVQTDSKSTERESHLRLIVIFHYVLGAVAGMFAMFPILHLLFGLMMLFSPESFEGQGEAPPAFLGWFFIILAGLFIVIGLAFAVCVIIAGRCIQKRTRYLFCLVMAGIQCMFVPFGTVLGVFTILLLMNEDVKAMFASHSKPSGSNLSVS